MKLITIDEVVSMLGCTSAPWTVSEVYPDDPPSIIGGDGFAVAETQETSVKESWDVLFPDLDHWSDAPGEAYIERSVRMYQANARLMAAAFGAALIPYDIEKV